MRYLLSRTDILVNDMGSILDGYEAVECGLIDEIGGIKKAIAYLKKAALKNHGRQRKAIPECGLPFRFKFIHKKTG